MPGIATILAVCGGCFALSGLVILGILIRQEQDNPDKGNKLGK